MALRLGCQPAAQHRLELRLWFQSGASDAARAAAGVRLLRQVGFILQASGLPDLRAAAQAAVHWVLLTPIGGRGRPAVVDVHVVLGAVGVGRRGGAAQGQDAVARAPASQPRQLEHKRWGWVDVVHVHAMAGVYRLNLRPGGIIPNHEHRRTYESELVLHPGLVGWRDGGVDAVLQAGSATAWQLGQPHGYRNTAGTISSILCVDSPPFDPADEVEVSR